MPSSTQYRTLDIGEADQLPRLTAQFAKAVRTWRDDLQVCLKILCILYQIEDQSSPEAPDGHRHEGWENGELPRPKGLRGDRLYLAVVMLNSALLKALHVADSFSTHCAREFP